MKISAILREAARRVERKQDIFSCNAINAVTHDFTYQHPAVIFYKGVLSPRGDSYLFICDFTIRDQREVSAIKARNHRVLALCMAATLADEEGR